MIEIDDQLTIPESDLRFTASRSSGPGGQHVNKTSSRITLEFDLDGSAALDESQKAKIRGRLAGRISQSGILRVSSQSSRSQLANRERAIERFAELLRDALAEKPLRRKTRVPKAVKERRVEEKKVRGKVKKDRGAVFKY